MKRKMLLLLVILPLLLLACKTVPEESVADYSDEPVLIQVKGSGPVGYISFSEGLFSPDDDGINDLLDIKISLNDELSDALSWSLNIYDSHGGEVISFNSDSSPTGNISWDGKKNGVLAVSSASDYSAVLISRDSLGNEGVANGEFSTDILVIKDGDSLRIRVNSITFKAFSADYMDVDMDQRESNLETLDLLASKLKKFPGYKITLEGHAVSIFWDNPAKALKENNEVLLPLSEARAQVIKDALQQRGVKGETMNIIGLGANRPIVPFADIQNRWKNRRVVFILTK